MELIYIHALASHLVGRLQVQRTARLSGDSGQATLETVLIIGGLAALAIAALAVLAIKIAGRTNGIDGGGSPPPTSYGF